MIITIFLILFFITFICCITWVIVINRFALQLKQNLTQLELVWNILKGKFNHHDDSQICSAAKNLKLLFFINSTLLILTLIAAILLSQQ